MHPVLLTSVLLLSTSLTSGLGIDGVRNTDDAAVRSICEDTEGFCGDLVCSYDTISLTLNVAKLKEKNINIPNIHLRDRRCTGFPYDDTKVYLSWSLGRDVCGNDLAVTDEYGTYTNQVFLPPTGIIYRELYIINVICSYPLYLNVSLPEVIRPNVSVTYINIGSTGQFKVQMSIYTDSSYTTPYTSPVVEFSTKENVYVGVYIVDPIPDYSLLMINCFSTPTNNVYDTLKYDLIINSCPNPQDTTVKILANGVSSMGKFYVQAFKFVGDHTYVYLHCQVRLCSPTCPQTCTDVRAAADVPEIQGTLSYGPIRLAGPEPDNTGPEPDNTGPEPDNTGSGTNSIASGFGGMIMMLALVLINRIFL